jgi:hypothetical protein
MFPLSLSLSLSLFCGVLYDGDSIEIIQSRAVRRLINYELQII